LGLVDQFEPAISTTSQPPSPPHSLLKIFMKSSNKSLIQDPRFFYTSQNSENHTRTLIILHNNLYLCKFENIIVCFFWVRSYCVYARMTWDFFFLVEKLNGGALRALAYLISMQKQHEQWQSHDFLNKGVNYYQIFDIICYTYICYL